MSDEKTVNDNQSIKEYPDLKEQISGKDVWKFLTRQIGDYLFNGRTYFQVNAPKGGGGENPIPTSLRNRVLGRVQTWAESAFERDRAESVKSVLREIISDEFNKARDQFESQATILLAEED